MTGIISDDSVESQSVLKRTRSVVIPSQSLTPERQLSLISKAWGKQRGYCFFPWIRGDADSRQERIRGYNEGPAFRWPADKDKILEHMRKHKNDDLYWCPSLFEHKRRQTEVAMDEHALWQDLDTKDPREIEDYPPTIAWESSPGRYQALWLISSGDMQGASWRGGENHRLCYYLDADHSGWDTTQLMRIPGWSNHKFEYRQANNGKPAKGKLLWATGRRYLPDEFSDLPEVEGSASVTETVLEDEIDRIDRHEVWGKVRLKVSGRVREMVSAKEASGDRSEALWEIERELADAGCTVTEIVSVVRETVWNKFDGRQDELKRLISEASKAVALREEKAIEPDARHLEGDEGEKPTPMLLAHLIKDVKPPTWLINEIWTEGSCGFISGQPKSFKSWVGLDMALSVSTGLPFLERFPVRRPGPVLYIQEEDPLPTVKARWDKVLPHKTSAKMVIEDGAPTWIPAEEVEEAPPIVASIFGGLVVSDAGWQSWLDDVLASGHQGENYRMMVIDPLMMVLGELDENRAAEMTEKVFRPLKVLARKHNVAIAVVHHMRKRGDDGSKYSRGGQLMLGSVANHAWSEDSLYLRLTRGGIVYVERESKSAPTGSFKIMGLKSKGWQPEVVQESDDEGAAWSARDHAPDDEGGNRRRRSSGKQGSAKSNGRGGERIIAALENGGVMTAQEIGGQLSISANGAYRQIKRLVAKGEVVETKTAGNRSVYKLA